jgi:hypothetical protein
VLSNEAHNGRVRVLTLLVVLATAIVDGASRAPEADGTAAVMEKFLTRPIVARQYRALRHLEASGGGQRGWLEAQTEFSPATGMRYEVTAEGGSGVVRSRVLRSLLEQERQLIAEGATASVAIDRANYRFSADGTDAEGRVLVALEPLRKDRALIAGTLFLEPREGDLIRIEGRLAKNPSFWTRRVDVVRAYARINDVVVPLSLESTAQLRLFGRSSLRMTYRYSHIDERSVEVTSDLRREP